MNERKAICEMNELGGVSIAFEGEHFNKRELLRIIKALKNEHRLSIRQYRKKNTEIKRKESTDDTRRNEDSGRKTEGIRRQTVGVDKTDRRPKEATVRSEVRRPEEIRTSVSGRGEGSRTEVKTELGHKEDASGQ